ncbi:Glycoside hydrolase [Mycena sanguinolenta]|uniref:Glycoside hydrolase n=1 Tax=Mycena sanguinolenta TaxID=230812 RepID=A0A8H6XKA0_9AGAR|nr:Glycoside hydrolase [Mycena sanguinolenta]
MAKQRVLILGATGRTGGSILNALLQDTDSFDLEALVRPASAEKPAVKDLAAQGVKIHVVDISGAKELVRVLMGVDVFISAIDAMGQAAQLQLVRVAKEAGVKRFVPCAFITVAPPGGSHGSAGQCAFPIYLELFQTLIMLDGAQKEEVYREIWKHFVPYTIIDVGFWYQLSFPTLPSGHVDYAALVKPKVEIHAGGSAPTMLTDLRDIGAFVARIIKDPLTLNKCVAAYGDVLSENEIFAMMEEMADEKIERKYARITADEIDAKRLQATASARAAPNDPMAQLRGFIADYENSKYVRGDNTPAYAKYLGYLDARELYPEFRPRTFRVFVAELLEGKGEMPSNSYGR